MAISDRGFASMDENKKKEIQSMGGKASGRNAKVEPFITGFLNAATQVFSGRPVYLLQMPDGAVLISDEQMGAIYRVSYGR